MTSPFPFPLPVTDAIEYIDRFVNTQGVYNPAALAALHHARRALTETTRLRAAAARLAESLEDLSRGTCMCPTGFDSCTGDGCTSRRAVLDDYRSIAGGVS